MKNISMSSDPSTQSVDLGVNTALKMMARVVSAYVSHNHVTRAELPNFIQDTFWALRNLHNLETHTPVDTTGAFLRPAVPIRLSVTPDAIICLEDGRALKSLRRHLKTSFNLTPDQYRSKWNLPPDYPMVAPNYALKRSIIARHSKLGRK